MWLGHMDKKDMMELQKRDLINGLKTHNLDLCKYCVLGNQAKVHFKVLIIVLNVFWTIFIKMCGAPIWLNHMEVLSTLSPLLMISLVKFGSIL